MFQRKRIMMRMTCAGSLWAILSLCLVASAMAAASEYDRAVELGRSAGAQAKAMLEADWAKSNTMVVTNAGYAVPGGHSTRGCLDGISEATGAKVGASRLLALQTRFDQPLWFAVFVPESGMCAYIEYDRALAAAILSGKSAEIAQATRKQAARIDADHLFSHAAEFSAQFNEGLFGANAFRIVTTANAMARNCGGDLLKAIEVHDHFCPGVTSGFMLATYVRNKLLPSPETECFVLSIKPWCKEDAMTTLLNATPGKRAYAVLYPKKGEPATWPHPLDKTCSVVFTKHGDRPWRGHMLGFDFDGAAAAFNEKDFGNVVVDKLYADLWFLDNMDKAGELVLKLKEFELEPGKSPRDFVRPGADTIGMLSKY